MNLFKGLLYQHGYLTDPRELARDFGPSYGNAQASARQFAESWELDGPVPATQEPPLATCPAARG